jgi:hypothetical protein
MVIKVHSKPEIVYKIILKGNIMSNTNQDFSKISGMVVFCQMAEPVKAYVKSGTPKKPDEFKCSIVLSDEDFVDELEAYGKSLDTLLSIKKVKTADFESVYKCAPPEDAGKNLWVFTLRKSVELGKTGKPLPEKHYPKVFEKIKNTIVEVTHTKIPANGSYGTLSIDRFDRTSGGSSLYLKNLLVTKMIEYVPAESDYQPGSEFEDDNASDGDGGNVKVPASAKTKAAPAKPKAAPKPASGFDDMDDDIPFATNSPYFDQTTSKERKMARYDF